MTATRGPAGYRGSAGRPGSHRALLQSPQLTLAIDALLSLPFGFRSRQPRSLKNRLQ
jgi:hypothetical protein